MLLQMALFHSFLWLSNIPLCMYTTSSASNHLSFVDGHLGCFHVLAIAKESCNEHAGACVFFKESFVRIYAQEWDHGVIW